MAETIIIGIDPGSTVTGWGIILERSGVLSLIDCGAIRSKGDTFAERLAHIYHSLHATISRCNPQEAAIEQVFTAANSATALKLGQARGVAVAACATFHLPIFDYAPTAVKKSLVGTGKAEKSQVAFMVGKILNTKTPWPLDTTDALAIAITHAAMRRYLMHSAIK